MKRLLSVLILLAAVGCSGKAKIGDDIAAGRNASSTKEIVGAKILSPDDHSIENEDSHDETIYGGGDPWDNRIMAAGGAVAFVLVAGSMFLWMWRISSNTGKLHKRVEALGPHRVTADKLH